MDTARRRILPSSWIYLSLIISAFIISSAALATPFTWVGGTGGAETDWGTATNWSPISSSPEQFPGDPIQLTDAFDTATFDNTGLTTTVEIGAVNGPIHPSLDSLNFNSPYTLTIDNNNSLSANSININPSGTLTLFFPTPSGEMSINSGATFSGFGSIMDITLNHSNIIIGTIAPGDNSTTAFLFLDNSDFTTTPNSLFQAKITGGLFPQQDALLLGTGSANLNGNGSLLIKPDHGFAIGFPYKILETFSGSVNGKFASLIQPAALDGTPSYDGSSVTYTINGLTAVVPNTIASYANQELALAEMATWFNSHLRDRSLRYQGTESSTHNPEDPTLWLTASSSSNKLNKSSDGFKINPKRLAFGIEKSAASSLYGAGLAITSFSALGSFAGENTQAKGHLYQLGAYTSQDQGPWRLGGNVNIGMSDDLDTQRLIDLGASNFSPATSQYRANELAAEALLAYLGRHLSNATLQPFLGLQYQWLGRNHFIEQGDTGLEMDVQHANLQSLHSRLGLSFAEDLDQGGVHPFALAAWEHEFADKRGETTASIPNAVTMSNVQGTPLCREILEAKLGLSLTRAKIWHFSAFYEGRHTKHYHENAAKLQASYNIL